MYYIEVRAETVDVRGVPEERLVFYVDPLLEVIDQRVTMLTPLLYEVAAQSFHPGSLRVYEMPGNILYYDGVNYTADPTTGQITLAKPLANGTYLSVDYRYTGTSTGPFPLPENGADVDAIPGVVLAFGRRAYDGDIMAVVVSDRREEVAKEFGGRWEMSLDFDIMARDLYAQGEITDRTLMFLYTEARERLSTEGIEITQASMGGEAEEVYDENGDDYFYTASIPLSVMTDWAIHIPTGRTLTRVETNTVSETEMVSGLTDDQLVEMGSPTGLQYTTDLGLRDIRDPWFRDRTKTYDLIGSLGSASMPRVRLTDINRRHHAVNHPKGITRKRCGPLPRLPHPARLPLHRRRHLRVGHRVQGQAVPSRQRIGRRWHRGAGDVGQVAGRKPSRRGHRCSCTPPSCAGDGEVLGARGLG